MSGCLAVQRAATIPAKPPSFRARRNKHKSKLVPADIVVRSELAHVCRAMANVEGVRDHHLGNWLTIRGMSQVELADAAGVGPNSVSRWVRKERGIKRKYLPKIASALRITPEQLLQTDPLKNTINVESEEVPIAQPASPLPQSESTPAIEQRSGGGDKPTETPGTNLPSYLGGEVAEILRTFEARLTQMGDNQRTILENQERFIGNYQKHDDGHRELADEIRRLRLQIADLSIAIREILNRAA